MHVPSPTKLEPLAAEHLVQVVQVALHERDLPECADVVRSRPAGFDHFEAAPPSGALLGPEPSSCFSAGVNRALGTRELVLYDGLRLGPMETSIMAFAPGD